MNAKHRRLVILVSTGLMSTVLTTSLMAIMTDFTISPDPVVVGGSTTYQAKQNGTGPPATKFKWEYRCLEPGCNDNWHTAPFESAGVVFAETNVGLQEVRCTAYYPPFPATAPTVITHTVEVKQPDNFVVTKGHMTPIANGPVRLEMNFKLRFGPIDLASIAGLAQERITNPATGFDSGWIPASPDPNFYLAGNTIIDKHRNEDSPAVWNSIAVGSIFDTVVLHERVVLTDCCGQQIAANLGSRTFNRRKVSATDWQNEVSPYP